MPKRLFLYNTGQRTTWDPHWLALPALLVLLSLNLQACSKPSSVDIEVSPPSSVSLHDRYGLGLRSGFAALQEIDLHYLSAGQGQTIVLLHGFPYFSGAWYKLFPALSENYRVIAPDLRGFGLSDKPEDPGAYQLSVLVEDIRQLVNQLSAQEPVILVGHDWGGVLAWSFAATYPEKVERMVVINAPPYEAFLHTLATSEPQRQASHYIPRLQGRLAPWLFTLKGPDMMWQSALQPLADRGLLDNRFKRAYFLAYETPGTADGALNWYRANIPAFETLRSGHQPVSSSSVSVPALLIWSERDKAFVRDTFERIPQHVEKLTVHLLDTSSHSPFLDTPQAVLDPIDRFLNR